jgi:hypothetical protein
MYDDGIECESFIRCKESFIFMLHTVFSLHETVQSVKIYISWAPLWIPNRVLAHAPGDRPIIAPLQVGKEEIWNLASTDRRPWDERLPAYISNRDYHDIFADTYPITNFVLYNISAQRNRSIFFRDKYKWCRRAALPVTGWILYLSRPVIGMWDDALAFGVVFARRHHQGANCDQVTDVQWKNTDLTC